MFGSVGFDKKEFNPNGKVSTFAYKPVRKVKPLNQNMNRNEEFATIVNPVGYNQVWIDKGSGAKRDGSVWDPICPENYARMGMVANAGYNKPAVTDCGCILEIAELIIARKQIPAGYVWYSKDIDKKAQTLFNGPARAALSTYSSSAGRNLLFAIAYKSAGILDGVETAVINSAAFTSSPNTLFRGSSLSTGEILLSANGQFGLVAQDDGNLVIYKQVNGKNDAPVWATNTYGNGACKLKLQAQDGNLCLSRLDNGHLWCSAKQNGAKLVMENDGRLVQYDNANKPIWSSR